jgi:hypothetical protein
MYKCDAQNMYDGSEYLQNILLKLYIYIIKSQHVFLSWHAMKNLQSMTPKEKPLKRF